MKILFCKVSSMKYYKGANEQDIPYNGGSFVEENGYGHEEYNFLPFQLDGANDVECLGFFEPKSSKGKRNLVHIEKIEGCGAMKKESEISDVLVVWCATREKGDITVVGWYNHATVYRELKEWTLVWEEGDEEDRIYNVRANASDCVLLPEKERNSKIWWVPSAKYTKSFGFGQSMVWYPNEPEARQYLKKLIENIETYNGENYLFYNP